MRRICSELASKNRTRNICERLLEYDACCDAGTESLLSPNELGELLDDVRKRGKKKIIWLGKERLPSKDARERAINALLVDEAKTWLYNTGVSKEEKDGRSSSRVSDIPIDLVEKCCKTSPELRRILDVAQAQPSGIAEAGIIRQDDKIIAITVEASAEEVGKLYSLLTDPKCVNAIVPVAQDALSGLGLYIVGEAFADPGNVDAGLLDHLFKYKRSADEKRGPFLAIMYRYQDMSPGHFKTADPKLFEPGTFESI